MCGAAFNLCHHNHTWILANKVWNGFFLLAKKKKKQNKKEKIIEFLSFSFVYFSLSFLDDPLLMDLFHMRNGTESSLMKMISFYTNVLTFIPYDYYHFSFSELYCFFCFQLANVPAFIPCPPLLFFFFFFLML